MAGVANELERAWRSRLAIELSEQSQEVREDIRHWLLKDVSRFDTLSSGQLTVAQGAIEFRYRLLKQRYLNAMPTQAYRKLLNRLGSLVMLRGKIQTWVSLSRDRRRAVADVLQEVIQEMLRSDRHIQAQIAWIAQCTKNKRLGDSLLFTSLEEYCLRPIRNQPLIAYRFTNYLRRQGRSGITQVPRQELLRLVSEESSAEESESSVNLLDAQAVTRYQEAQDWEEQQTLRLSVQRKFERHLLDNFGEEAVQWLQLYLQGRSQEAIANTLNVPIEKLYRLREKVGYHALRIFSLKREPELVSDWLKISLQEHNLGLTPKQWEGYWQKLTPAQRQIVESLKSGKSFEMIAQELKWSTHKVAKEWSKLYLTAQALRNT